MSFKDTVTVITGIASGMGLQIALDLLEKGGKVAGIDISDCPKELQEASSDSNLMYFKIDLTDIVAVEDAVKEVIAKFHKIDNLANVAGVLWFEKDKSLLDIDLDVWDQVMQINLKSMVHTIRTIVPHMKNNGGGSIVNFSTIQAIRGDRAPQDAYSASKGAVLSLSKSVAMQWGCVGIRCNTILPGPVYTPLQKRWDDTPEIVEAISNHLPIGRIGVAKDLSNACLFLFSKESGFITGIDMPVDGGLSICC